MKNKWHYIALGAVIMLLIDDLIQQLFGVGARLGFDSAVVIICMFGLLALTISRKKLAKK